MPYVFMVTSQHAMSQVAQGSLPAFRLPDNLHRQRRRFHSRAGVPGIE